MASSFKARPSGPDPTLNQQKACLGSNFGTVGIARSLPDSCPPGEMNLGWNFCGDRPAVEKTEPLRRH